MKNGQFNGVEQPFYFPDDHPVYPGYFKGMAQILTKRGYNVFNKKAQCKEKCPVGTIDCCCQQMMWHEPDFVMGESQLENLGCEKYGVKILFLPKYHCKLNFIEQCWGFSKHIYRMYPPSSKAEDLEHNVLKSLQEVSLTSMRQYQIFKIAIQLINIWQVLHHSIRFMDAYSKGLNGTQSAWAAKKYKGHRLIPADIFTNFDP